MESIDPDGLVHPRGGEPVDYVGLHPRDDEADPVPSEIGGEVAERARSGRVDVRDGLGVEDEPAGRRRAPRSASRTRP